MTIMEQHMSRFLGVDLFSQRSYRHNAYTAQHRKCRCRSWWIGQRRNRHSIPDKNGIPDQTQVSLRISITPRFSVSVNILGEIATLPICNLQHIMSVVWPVAP